jgi:hypothetical protein
MTENYSPKDSEPYPENLPHERQPQIRIASQ